MLLDEEQELIQRTASQFADVELKPNAANWDESAKFPKEAIKALGELGFMGMIIPEEHGGAGTSFYSYILALEEIAAGDASCSTIMSVNNSVVCTPILKHGNDYQKETFLKPLANGEKLGAFCLTEPGAGSDASQIATTAIKKDDTYILSGTKQFITSGKNADYAIVFAQTAPELGKKGLSAFIVPTDAEGYVVANVEDKLGQKASDTAQIVFDNCVVSEKNLLGQEGEGYKIALSNLEGGRIGIAAQAVGIAKAAIKEAVQYCKERKSFGKTLYEHQAIAFQLAEMETDMNAARALGLDAARLKDANKPCIKEASMAKLFASQMVERVCSKALHLLGGYGYLKDFPLERYYRDAKVIQIYEGTNEIQKMVIAKSMLNS